jgi:hypothetical protein
MAMISTSRTIGFRPPFDEEEPLAAPEVVLFDLAPSSPAYISKSSRKRKSQKT